MSDGISISAAELDSWRTDKDKLTKEISDLQAKLATVEKRLDAAAVLAVSRTQQELPLPKPQEKKPNGNGLTVTHLKDVGDTLIDHIEAIANQSPSPLTKRELKQTLVSYGFDDPGPYFYTVIMRLKSRNKISVQHDGKIWKSAQ
jgi:hypothetical protein